MAIKIGQSLGLGQNLTMTPQLQQAIKLLQLSRLELEQFVEAQMAENPVLEEVPNEASDDYSPIVGRPDYSWPGGARLAV